MIGLLIRDGRLEPASHLVRGLTWAPLSAVYASASGLAFETAQPLAHDHGLDVSISPALKDIDGETHTQLQQRIVAELLTLAKRHPDETIALVTYAEPIRCALAAFGGGSLDELLALEISPEHVSAIGITPDVRRVLSVNVPVEDIAV